MTNRQIADKLRKSLYQALTPFIGKNIRESEEDIKLAIRGVLNDLVDKSLIPEENEGGYTFGINASINRPEPTIVDLDVSVSAFPRYEARPLEIELKVP